MTFLASVSLSFQNAQARMYGRAHAVMASGSCCLACFLHMHMHQTGIFAECTPTSNILRTKLKHIYIFYPQNFTPMLFLSFPEFSSAGFNLLRPSCMGINFLVRLKQTTGLKSCL